MVSDREVAVLGHATAKAQTRTENQQLGVGQTRETLMSFGSCKCRASAAVGSTRLAVRFFSEPNG